MFSGNEVDFARSLLDKQHEFNGTSLEVNKIWQSFYLGRHAQQKFVYKNCEVRVSAVRSRLASISFSFYQTNLLSSPQSRYTLGKKKLF